MTASLLILTDFFHTANRALRYAAGLAAPLRARLVLLHVRPELPDDGAGEGELSNLNEEAVRLALGCLADDLAVPAAVEVGRGSVAAAVADSVRRHHPALVVLGRSHPRPDAAEPVVATSLELLRTAAYPMLVVPHEVVAAHPPRRVLLAADGDAFTLGEHAGTARHLLNSLRAELTVLGVGRTEPEAALDRALESVARTGLTIDLPPMRGRAAVAADVAEGILQAARGGEYELLVLVARRRSFWGQLFHRSVTARVLLGSPLPVLLLPAQE
ncbi:universal stress protein [Hymenobacter sp. B81]|uniref:universal stress protein n=1 Tax=Hymenobacter sp. B81 TaxID=3344878 RepID=UPI0037DC1425